MNEFDFKHREAQEYSYPEVQGEENRNQHLSEAILQTLLKINENGE
jgi:hypothetical protein